MTNVQILLLVNSIVLSILSVMFLIIGYFVKDIHKDFKSMVERVNTLYNEVNTHALLTDSTTKNMNHRVSGLYRKIRKLETYRAEKTSSNEVA